MYTPKLCRPGPYPFVTFSNEELRETEPVTRGHSGLQYFFSNAWLPPPPQKEKKKRKKGLKIHRPDGERTVIVMCSILPSPLKEHTRLGHAGTVNHSV